MATNHGTSPAIERAGDSRGLEATADADDEGEAAPVCHVYSPDGSLLMNADPPGNLLHS